MIPIRALRRIVRPRRGLVPTAAAVLALGIAAAPQVSEAIGEMSLAALAEAVRAECRVTEVVDADTVTLACPGRAAERARLTGFDTPELFSPQCAAEREAAERARRHLAAMVDGRLGVVREGRDRYGRVLVALSVDGRAVAEEMISAGLARAYDGGRREGWCDMELAAAG